MGTGAALPTGGLEKKILKRIPGEREKGVGKRTDRPQNRHQVLKAPPKTYQEKTNAG